MRKRALYAGLGFCAVLGLAVQAWALRPERLIDAGVTGVTQSANDDSNVDTEIQRTIGWAKGKLPIPLSGGNAILLGLAWESQFVNYNNFKTTRIQGNTVTESDLPETLTALDLTVGFYWKMTKEWSVLGQFMPGIHSDFEDISSDDYIYNGSLLFMRSFGKVNRFGIGAAYSDALGDPQLIPLLLIDWYPTREWFVEGTLPLDLDVGYRFKKELALGLEYKLKGYMYRLSEDDPWEDAVLKYREVQIGPFVDWMFHDKAHMRVSAGASVAQKSEIRDDNNDHKLVDGDYKNAGYATLNLFYTL